MVRFKGAAVVLAVATVVAMSEPAASLTIINDNPVLTYDNPILHVSVGGSIEITATLSLPSVPGEVGLFDTDANGNLLPANPYVLTNFFPIEQQVLQIYECSFGTPLSACRPLYPLQAHSAFAAKSPNPLGNLRMVDGSSVDLDLGTLTVDSLLAPGTYTTDIGVGEDTSFLDCSGVCITSINPFPGPSIDAGPLTIVVSAVPEPSTIAIFGTTLLGLGSLARRNRA